jgi:hypothetical protein
MKLSSDEGIRQFDVVIIGAGFAGLAMLAIRKPVSEGSTNEAAARTRRK